MTRCPYCNDRFEDLDAHVPCPEDSGDCDSKGPWYRDPKGDLSRGLRTVSDALAEGRHAALLERRTGKTQTNPYPEGSNLHSWWRRGKSVADLGR